MALFDNRDTFSYSAAEGRDASPMTGFRGDGMWNRDAYVNEGVTFDAALAHQAGSNYHYHANTPALRHLLGDHVDYDEATKRYAERPATPTRHSPLLGFLVDGFPVYGPYGYAAARDPNSDVRRMISGYVKRDGERGTTDLRATGRNSLPAWAARAQGREARLSATAFGPPVNETYGLGHYLEDYDYLGELGKTPGKDFDLDLYNGRFCVTPEFPQGTYAYFLTIEPDGTPVFPYTVGRWFYGTPQGGNVREIAEPVTEQVHGGPASPIEVTAVRAGEGAHVSWSSVEGGTYAVAASDDGVTYMPVASAVISGGLTTAYLGAPAKAFYRVTLTALAAFDPRGTGGISGLGGSGVGRLAGPAAAEAARVPATTRRD